MQDTIGSVPDAVSRGRECAARRDLGETLAKHFGEPDEVARDPRLVRLRDAAADLAHGHIYRADPSLPFCRICLMSGLNGRPIAHLPSCPVGRVFAAIEELSGN